MILSQASCDLNLEIQNSEDQELSITLMSILPTAAGVKKTARGDETALHLSGPICNDLDTLIATWPVG